jgi:hypothetical protein
MIILNFYFTENGGWIKYNQNGEVFTQNFDTAESLYNFIKDNDLPLTYKGCVNCPSYISN